jgi:CheY-like chemotaxis protein
MDIGASPGALIDAFTAARAREANGALLAVRVEPGGARSPAALDEAVGGAIGRIAGAVRIPLGRDVHGLVLPVAGAPASRSAAERVRADLAPAPTRVGIANFYEFFTADGTAKEIAREIERTALRRLEAAARAGGVCDAGGPAAPGDGGGPRAFVVEPDPVSVELLVAALEADGFTVSRFREGEAALASIAADPPDLVICEAMTPRLNGFVIRERMRADRRLAAVPFVLVSHRKTEDMIRRAVEADIRHFFRKPLSIVEVTGLARNLVRDRTGGAPA